LTLLNHQNPNQEFSAMKRLPKNLVRHGLTLIELVVVMAILISLAAIILPRLDFVKGQADNAATATNAADLSKVIETNRVNSGSYGAFDLLGDGNGALLPSLWGTNVFSGQGATAPAGYTSTTIPGPTGPAGPFYYQSFLDAGLNGIVNSAAATNASNSDIPATGSAVVVNLSNAIAGATGPGNSLAVLAGNSGNPYADQLFTTLVPSGTIGLTQSYSSSTDTSAPGYGSQAFYLVAMGIGPSSSIVGTLIASAPQETQGDDPAAVYCRYIGIWKVYASGKPAQLLAVVDHRSKTIDTNIQQFNQRSSTN
jgi:prepilin-type N-terminal cleavage/methylation domain-containing protein